MGLFSSGDDDDRDAKYVVIDEDRDGRLSGGTKVTIPTQSNEKSISQAGWSVGGFIERSTSSGKVIDEPLDAYCVLFLVREHELVIGLRESTKNMFPSTEPSKTLYIGYDEIRGINFPSGGRILGRSGPTTLQTDKDEFKFHSLINSKYSDVGYDELEEFILSKMKESKISDGEKSETAGDSESIGDEIEQLSNLHGSGALSDEEFKAAKERVLGDKIPETGAKGGKEPEPDHGEEDTRNVTKEEAPKLAEETATEPAKETEVGPLYSSDSEPLTQISGVGSEKAEVLHEAGYETLEDIQEASQQELSDIEDIGDALAARIKADVDGS